MEVSSIKLSAVLLAVLCLAVLAPSDSFAEDLDHVSDDALLEEISRAAFLYFINEADPESGLVRDKTSVEFSSTAATGFGLAALPIGAERGWISRTDAEERALRTLRTLSRSPAQKAGVFCHFLDLHTGEPTPLGY